MGARCRVGPLGEGRWTEHNMYRCQKGPLKIIFQIWAKSSTFPKIGILEPKHGSISPTASRPLRPHGLSGRSVAPLRSVPRPPTTSPTRDRSPPAPSRTRTVLTDRSVARADLAFAPRRPLPPPTASEAFAPSEVATTDLAPNARGTTGALVGIPASPRPRKANRSSSTRSQSPTSQPLHRSAPKDLLWSGIWFSYTKIIRVCDTGSRQPANGTHDA